MTAWSGPVITVKRTVLNGFGDVRCADGVGGVEVGNRERHFQDTVVGAGAEAQARHGALQQALAVGGDVAILADLPRAHLGIAINLFPREAAQLALAGFYDAFTNQVRTFPARVLPQLLVADGGHVDVDIDAIEQGPGNLRDVALDEGRRAGALARGVI